MTMAMDEAMVTASNSALPAGAKRNGWASDSEVDGVKGHAAGVLFVEPAGHVLLLLRSADEANYPGHWALPGGGVEADETPRAGAARECVEEIGRDADIDRMKLLDRRITPTGMAFHTFANPVDDRFVPKLNGEHTGYAWAPLDRLPQPLHPSVAATVKDRIGGGTEINTDMMPAERTALLDEFLEWARRPDPTGQAADSRFAIAMDRASVREKTRDGRLIVKKTHISKANVSPYRGSEIPGWQELGLDPDRVYRLLRDPDELRKAAPTLNGVQLLIKHIPVSAEDHRPNETVGSLGSEAEFDGEYLDNSLYVNARHAIDAIESDAQKELSAGYHYKPDMTPGNFRGSDYDGVMRDIVFNHVALVENGRVGPDVVVGDSTEKLHMTKPTRIAVATLSLSAAALAPMLAMDSKVTLSKGLFAPLTTKNFKDHKQKLLAGVRTAINGKLRRGLALDASMEQFAKAIDTFSDMPEAMDTPASETEAKRLDVDVPVDPLLEKVVEKKVGDWDAARAFLAEKGLSDEDIAAALEMMAASAGAEDEADEDDEDEKKKLAAEKKAAEDSAKQAKGAMEDMVTKPAMDAALRATAETVAKQVRASERDIRAALAEVRPLVGEFDPDMAFDSGDDVRRHALEMLGVENAKTMHADALKAVLAVQQPPGAHRPETPSRMALDAAASSDFATRYADASRIVSV